jgi:hypothetical protein
MKGKKGFQMCRSCHVKTNYNREYWIKYFSIKKDNKNEQ